MRRMLCSRQDEAGDGMDNDNAAQDKYRAPALDKGLDILEFLSSQANGVTRAEIVKAIGRSQSEIYRMLERLVARAYVSRSAEGDRYQLTMKLFELGSQHPPIRRLAARAQPLMDAFSNVNNQSVHLVMPDRESAVVVAEASGAATWEFRLRVGARLSLIDTSSGQTLLAFQPREHLQEKLALWGAGAIAARVAVIEEVLAAIRQCGYRVGDSLQLAGVRDLSVPVLGVGTNAIAVLTCPYLRRIDQDGESEDAVLGGLMALAKRLSIN